MKTTRTLRLAAAALLLAATAAPAQTTIHATDAFAYGANVGWLNCRAANGGADGLAVGQFHCRGYAHGANIGWVSFGDGTPANGHTYTNTDGADHGVNVTAYTSNGTAFEAKLRGLAYGANVGWLNFETTGDPRVDLATGQLRGFAWGANIGWVRLDGFTASVTTTSLAAGPDSDADTLPDAWELARAGHLALGTTATSDADGDGVPDRAEYAADTDPLNGSDRLRILSLVPPRELVPASGQFFTDLAWTSRPTRRYAIETTATLGTWTLLGSDIIPATGTSTTVQFQETPAPTGFYRIAAKLPLAP